MSPRLRVHEVVCQLRGPFLWFFSESTKPILLPTLEGQVGFGVAILHHSLYRHEAIVMVDPEPQTLNTKPLNPKP